MKAVKTAQRLATLIAFTLVGFGAQVPKDLVQRLKASGDRERHTAVVELSKLRTEDAVKLMLEAMSDSAPRVADTAQQLISPMLSEDSFAPVAGKKGLAARDTLLQLRAAEACGRIGFELNSDWSLVALKSKDERVRSTALWSLERLLKAGQLEAGLSKKTRASVKKMLKDKSGHVRGAALHVLAAAATEGPIAELEGSLHEKNPAPQRAAAVQIYSGDTSTKNLTIKLQIGLSDKDSGVRRCAVEEIAKHPSKELILNLAQRLYFEPSLRLRWAIVQVLQRLSGRKHRDEAAAWESWAKSLDDNWKKADEVVKAALDVGDVTTSFAGLRLLSKRVCFLVDFSGSLWMNGKNGKTRKEAADIEVRKALESLPFDAMFNLIPYTNEPIPWKRSLVPANAKNVEKAIKWFEKRKDVGKGNFWDALQLALEDPMVDNVVALTDGAPSGGHRWDLKLMAPLFAERNRFRRIVLDAVLVDCSSNLVWMWRALCGEAGGTIIEIEL